MTEAALLPDILAGLPGRNVGRFGRPGDPLNLVFLGTRDSLRLALGAAGWTELPLSVLRSCLEGAVELARDEPLRRFPPMNAYRVAGRKQDFNWVKAVRPISARHHFRLWRVHRPDRHGRAMWWGSANYDAALRLWDLSHVPDPDNDAERDFIAASLAGSPRVEWTRLEPLAQIPASGVNDKGHRFKTDGRALVVSLRPLPAPGEARQPSDSRASASLLAPFPSNPNSPERA